MKKEELLELAFKAMENAYAPYSNYQVGACVICKDGKYFLGANIENASYGLTNCGERSAIFAAYSNGYKKADIEAIAIVTTGKILGYPCGACRQVLAELLSPDTPIYLSNRLAFATTSIKELLPYTFTAEDLRD